MLVMKAILEFDLENEDARIAHRAAIAAPDLVYCLHEHLEWLRDQLKHHNAPRATEKCRDNLLALINDNEIFHVVEGA